MEVETGERYRPFEPLVQFNHTQTHNTHTHTKEKKGTKEKLNLLCYVQSMLKRKTITLLESNLVKKNIVFEPKGRI